MVRFSFISLLITTVLSRLWSASVAYRAGSRLGSGEQAQLTTRKFTRSSLVSEEDSRDPNFKWLILLVTLALTAADLLVEFGSDSKEVLAGGFDPTGYDPGSIYTPVEIVDLGDDEWAPAGFKDRGFKTSYSVVLLSPENMIELNITDDDVNLVKSTEAWFVDNGKLLTSAVNGSRSQCAGFGPRVLAHRSLR